MLCPPAMRCGGTWPLNPADPVSTRNHPPICTGTMNHLTLLALLFFIAGSVAGCSDRSFASKTRPSLTVEELTTADGTWGHQEIEVTGAYWGRVWSSVSQETTVLLANKAGQKVVGCRLTGKADGLRGITQHAEGLTVRGVVHPEPHAAGYTILDTCTLLLP